MKLPDRGPTTETNGALKRWHRRIGVAASLFVILLAFSGFSLNHPELLELDRLVVRSPLVLGWYGIELPDAIDGHALGAHWMSQVGGKVFLDTVPLTSCRGELVGAVESGGEIAVACAGELLLLSATGELQDRIDATYRLPVPVEALGTRDGQLLLRAQGRTFRVEPEAPSFTALNGAEPAWSVAAPLPPALVAQLAPRAAGDAITLERLVLDIHSGRILGHWGVYWMDGVAVLMVLLALTGLKAWRREQR
ncbi:MAG: hypothetical protein WAV22_13200 [Porticoccaceae bacterium]